MVRLRRCARRCRRPSPSPEAEPCPVPGSTWTCRPPSSSSTAPTPADSDSGGQIIAAAGGQPIYHFPGLAFDDAIEYEVEASLAAVDGYFGVLAMESDTDSLGDNHELYYSFPPEQVITATVGPGIGAWDDAIADNYNLVRFDSPAIDGIRYRTMTRCPCRPDYCGRPV